MDRILPDPKSLARAPLKRRPDPASYVADPALERAVHVALALGMPLLLTGEPGTGKTQLAYRMAWEMAGCPAFVDPQTRKLPETALPLRFDTKSTSVASDLFYQFDSVRHYADSQLAAISREPVPMPKPQGYITYRALGLAVLHSRDWTHNEPLVSPQQRLRLQDQPPQRRVVLIDEVDKASRDFPNDLLNQLEEFSFDAPEIGAWGIEANRDQWPIVVITSNSERQLPEAFLRRCVYHHIELPKAQGEQQAWVARILRQQFEGTPLAEAPQTRGGQDAIAAFWSLREQTVLQKPPSTTELLEWLQALRHARYDWQSPLKEQLVTVRGCLGALLKTSDDLARGAGLLAAG